MGDDFEPIRPNSKSVMNDDVPASVEPKPTSAEPRPASDETKSASYEP